MRSTIRTTGEATAADSIAVLLVNWNGWQNSLKCVEALRRSKGANWRAYIVDNASTDESIAKLEGLGPDVVLIKSPVNTGWTGGTNLGVEAAMAAGHPYIFILNNDAFVHPDTLTRLVDFHKAAPEPKPVLGPIQMDGAGRGYSFIGADRDPYSLVASHRKTTGVKASDLPEVMPTDYIVGAGIFAGREAFQKIGAFDDRFYLNFDEMDWCFRAAGAGVPLLMLRDAMIDHVGSASIGGVASPLNRYFMIRNIFLLLDKHGTVRHHYRQAKIQIQILAAELGEGWLWRFLTSPEADHRAYRRAIADYLLRRFGPCPPVIRELQRQARD